MCQDLRTRNDWPVKKIIVRFANQAEEKFAFSLRQFAVSVGGQEKGHRRCFTDVTKRG